MTDSAVLKILPLHVGRLTSQLNVIFHSTTIVTKCVPYHACHLKTLMCALDMNNVKTAL